MDKKRSEKRKVLKDLKEKIKIDAKVWQGHIEHQFLPERSSGSFFLSKISIHGVLQ